ncbi:hypothetical protein GS982_01180 [Rhodococcus hoagii]|uniref:Uncharacterized protein n=1 Tax=Rhodococcus hoagii TaxID=43767 RepID=A0A9Q5EW09_RHOHA|nr:hypothetical protein [Prescottella equi]NKT77220.1 hypothetical protein [Prescottella equi]NKZ81004.1 hypothetical protein [Prescottella equi]
MSDETHTPAEGVDELEEYVHQQAYNATIEHVAENLRDMFAKDPEAASREVAATILDAALDRREYQAAIRKLGKQIQEMRDGE